jgi:hypothetical protein
MAERGDKETLSKTPNVVHSEEENNKNKSLHWLR